VNSKERIAVAMSGGEPDRVPVMCQMSIGHILRVTGVSPPGLWHDPQVYAGALYELRDRYGFDGILVSVPGGDPDWRAKLRDLRETGDGVVVEYSEPLENRSPYPLGLESVYPWDDIPRPAAAIVPPEPGQIAPDSVDTLDEVPGWMLANLAEVVARNAGRYSIHGETFSPFDALVNLLGIEGAMLALLDAPAWSHEVLERGLAYSANWAIAQARAGADAIKVSSPYVGGGLLSRPHYVEFVQPYETRLVEAVRSQVRVPLYTHTCGAIGDRLELIADSGVQGLECLDPPPLGNVELADAKRRVGDRLFIKGNVDSVHVLLPGQPEVIDRVAAECIRVGAPGGGYILSTACSIAPGVAPESVERLVRAVEARP